MLALAYLRPEKDQSIWSKRRQGFQPCCEAGIREPTLLMPEPAEKPSLHSRLLLLTGSTVILVNLTSSENCKNCTRKSFCTGKNACCTQKLEITKISTHQILEFFKMLNLIIAPTLCSLQVHSMFGNVHGCPPTHQIGWNSATPCTRRSPAACPPLAPLV